MEVSSLNSLPFNGIASHRFGQKMYSIESWVDHINC